MRPENLVLFFLVGVCFAQTPSHPEPMGRKISIAASGFLQNNLSTKIEPNLPSNIDNNLNKTVQFTIIPQIPPHSEPMGRKISIAASGFIQNNLSTNIQPKLPSNIDNNLNNTVQSTRTPEVITENASNIDNNLNNTAQSTGIPEVKTENDFTTLSMNIISTENHSTTINNLKETSESLSKSTGTSTDERDAQSEEIKEEFRIEIQNSPLIEATKELQEEQYSKLDDPKEDFLHFVQTALRSTSERRGISSNNALALIKKLISNTPKLKNMPTTERTQKVLSPEKRTPETSQFGSSQTYENDYFYLDSKVQSDLNSNIHRGEELPFSIQPHQISSKRTAPFEPKKLRPEPEFHLGGSHRQVNNEQYNFEFGGGGRAFGYNDNPRTDVGQYEMSFLTTPKYQHQKRRFQKLTRRHNNFYRYDSRTESEDNQEGYRTFIQPPFKTTVPLQKQVSPSSIPRRKMEEEDYDPTESKRQAESAKYSFASDIEDNINGNIHQRQESREGSKVTGAYTYEDGFFRRTVHYVADENGYRVVKEEVVDIGDGPSYNPDGSAKFHANIAGTNVNYQITNKDISRMEPVHYQQPIQYVQNRRGWRY